MLAVWGWSYVAVGVFFFVAFLFMLQPLLLLGTTFFCGWGAVRILRYQRG